MEDCMNLSGRSVVVSILALAAGIAPEIATAQDAESGAETVANGERIVVTGTLIRGSREDAPAPVSVITSDDLALQGAPTLMDLAKALPTSAGVIGDSSQFDTRSQFNQGSASINLRGLGPQRTLVLLNGNRMVPTGAGSLPLVDVNLFPVSAVGRIEVLKDGAAATYGSDAVAGVVNVITRTDQDGFLVGGDYRYIDGSDGDWSAQASFGRDYGAFRVFLSGGYQERNELRPTDRDWALRDFAENPQGGFTGGGNPGNFDFDGTNGGLAFVADEGCEALGGFRALPGSSGDLCSASYLGVTNLVEPEQRYQLFADIEADLGGDTTLRLTGLYGRTETVLHTSPSFLPTISPSANAAFGGTGLFVIPSYAPALADYCARFGAASGCAVDAGGAPTQSALAYPVRFRPVLAGGNPLFDNDRGSGRFDRDSDAYQLTAELAAPLGDRLDLTLGATYSEYDRFFEVGDAFVDLLQNALAGFGGPNCAYADPATRAGLSPAQLAAIAGTEGCTWFNPFSTGVEGNAITGQSNPGFAGNGSAVPGLDTAPGAGLVNDIATWDQIYNTWDRTANTQQLVFDATIAGETGLMLGGGPVTFALGGQYRRDRYARTFSGGNNLDLFPCAGSVLDPDATCASDTGALGFIGSGRDFAVSSDVWAVFGEAQMPVTERLTAQLSARFESYGERAGSTFDPQLRLRYEASDWLVLRGGVGTSFRGPPPNQTSADLVKLTFIGGAFRAIDLLANPDLAPESATTWNAGALVDSNSLRLSVDYWGYDVSGAIEDEPIGGMVAAMFGASGTANCGDPAYAALEARFTFSGNVCGSGNVQRVATFATNSSDMRTSGLDVSASHDLPMGEADLQIGASGTYVLEYKVDDVLVEGMLVQPAFDAAGKLNYQTTAYPIPRLKGQAWVQALVGDHAFRLQANHVSSYEDQRGSSIFGPNPSLAGASVTEGKTIASQTTFDLTWRWTIETGTAVSLALSNIFDTDPPFARLDQNYDPFTASALGFTAKIGILQAF